MTRRNATERDNREGALYILTSRQSAAVDLVAVGQTDQEVADAVGVSRQTVNVWRNQHPAFTVAVEDRRREVWSAAADRLRSLLPKAVDRLAADLDGPDGARVALALVKLAVVAHTDHGLRPTGPIDAGAVIDDRARRVESRMLSAPLSGLGRSAVIGNMIDRLSEVESETAD